ncbi:hypothetical protein PR202_gb09160 [Eleusine coracana subsp. coracana]|uniref:CN hydrolase domain-containing protein n=1 Tax=Eleusine coracana subsp. coracana TaxID=191504 RepID=A0AAV5EGU3_ELECO|nr:hypothetical protein PR202_gb09160 [Eleusine coracana subsp. coracana]
MALAPASSGSGSVIAEVEMNGGADQGAATVRATVVQASTVFYDTPATLDKVEKLVAEAAGYGSQLILFPEVFVGGYPHGSTFGLIVGNRSAKGKEDFRKYHAAAIDVPGPEVSILAALAGKYKVFLVIGVVERAGYTLYNTVLSFDSLGKYLGKHRKLMPTALERVFWGFGDGSTIPVYDTPLGKIGSAICWENRMPLLRTAMYAKVLAGPNYEGEALLTADLDLGEIVRAKFDFDVVGHYSRPEVLSLVVKTDPKPAVSFTSDAEKGDDVSKS